MKPVDLAADLQRLGERSASDLASPLRELSARGPDATELASLATRLSLQGVAMTPPAAVGPAVGASSVRGAGWKLALVGTAAIGGFGWWFFSPGPADPNALQPARRAAVASLASASPPGGVPAERFAPSGRERAGLPTSAASAAPSSVAASLGPTPPSSSTPSASPSPSLEVRPRALQTREAGSTLPQPAPHHENQVRGTSSAAQGAAASGAELPAADPAQPSELELLRGARLALKGSPAEALRLVEQHRVSYPAGKLTQERELIAISALLGLGRRTAALSRAAKFEQAFPSSPYRKQIGELLQ